MASASSYHRLPEPDDLMECPYDKAHIVRFKKLPYHLMKCRQNHTITYVSCPFDARHHVPKPELSLHIKTCPQSALVERDIANALQQNDSSVGGKCKGVNEVPPYDAWVPPEPEEDWGSGISYNDDAASPVTWTAPLRDRQSLIDFRTPTDSLQEPSRMSSGKQQQQPLKSDFHQVGNPANLQSRALQQPTGLNPIQQQPWSPLPASSLQQLALRIISSASIWQQPLPERKLPGSEAAKLEQSNVQPLQAGRGSVGQAENFVPSDMVAKETINQDLGRSRFAAHFQHAGIKNENLSGSIKTSTIESCVVSSSRRDGAAQLYMLPTDSVLTAVKSVQPSNSGDGSGAGDPVQQLQLKLKRIAKKLRQISDLEKKAHLDDDQKKKLDKKAELERERDAAEKELEQLGGI